MVVHAAHRSARTTLNLPFLGEDCSQALHRLGAMQQHESFWSCMRMPFSRQMNGSANTKFQKAFCRNMIFFSINYVVLAPT